MSDIDIDINNYNIKELECFFGLSKIYTISDVDLRESIIREQLLSSGTINKRFKRDLINFLSQAKKILITVKFPSKSLNPTTIPNNEPLDNSNYPYESPSIPYLREGDLIDRQHLPFIFSKPEEFVPGNLNPLNTRIVRKCVTIDTRFRKDIDTTQSSDFIVQLPFKLLKVVSMEMNSIDLPLQFYGISTSYGNNYFYISLDYLDNNDCQKCQTKCVIIPDGNYNSYDLLTVLNKSLSDNNDIFSKLYFSLNILAGGSGTKKVILEPYPNAIEKILNITLDFSTDIDGNYSNIDITTRFGWNLGFVHRQYAGFTKYVSDSVFEPTSIRYVYLSVEDFNSSVNNVFLSAFDKVNLDTNILAKINIQNSDFNVPIISEPRKYFGPVDITRLRIRLYDEFGRIIDMNDTNYSFCLLFNIMYDL
jgi:hypothetical protein